MLCIGTYDVQAVTISQQDQSLRISCSYAENSLAQGCKVTVCLRAEGEVGFRTCSSHTFQRGSSAEADVVPTNETGTYVITDVADIEEDGSISVIGNITVFGVLEAPPLPPEVEGNISAASTMTVVGEFYRMHVYTY